ncbi:MAG: nucleoside triphosphate pyrophosphohydrolase family protein [Candidatus Staskawiczbacteria bacterium]|jgi:NTP pyrophosphatase (non-canonical NTP hydrolase)
MNFEEYQKAAHKTSQCPKIGEEYIYPVLGLCGEAGELANKVKKIFRDDGYVLTDARKGEIKKELGDILWYVAEISTKLGLEMDNIASSNIEKLTSRLARGTITGDGDTR